MVLLVHKSIPFYRLFSYLRNLKNSRFYVSLNMLGFSFVFYFFTDVFFINLFSINMVYASFVINFLFFLFLFSAFERTAKVFLGLLYHSLSRKRVTNIELISLDILQNISVKILP